MELSALSLRNSNYYKEVALQMYKLFKPRKFSMQPFQCQI